MKLMRHLVCFLFGHLYRVDKVYTRSIKRVKCTRCGGRWGMNDEMKIILPWDSEMERFHNELMAPPPYCKPPRKERS